jgi:hypothetical protein
MPNYLLGKKHSRDVSFHSAKEAAPAWGWELGPPCERRSGENRRLQNSVAKPKFLLTATLEDGGKYITRLSKVDYESPEWQAAMEALILVAMLAGPTMFARIGVMRALNRNVERTFTGRKPRNWARRKLKRDM